ncbi:CAMK/CAMKL/KIN4 protein kinase [Kwoniella heveanensis BCC8398]|uniref:non-specific serine/threonine protein kinase n=1 Tax=Kwoniella heveanensis BCC8398 TaxID=1296120 RepID=A0A1B9GU63_9TREE|nr:CAMK/CAMKL/KIN4 protein kinase [Kwoniella heveanensis BCC8398]
MADPFAANPHISSSEAAARYSTPPLPHSYYQSYPQSTDTTMAAPRQPANQPGYRASTGPGQTVITDEFGSYSPGHAGPSQSTSAAAAARQRQSMPMPLPAPEPTASTSHTYASSHSHSAQQQQSRAANRRSHNPTSTLGSVSPPKPEYLTDEYVLHPSVYSYKQAHPRRPMIGFGPYVLLQTLGEGEFGKVKLGVHTDYGVEVAIKLIRRGSLDDEVRASKVEREIDVLKTLKHPNIVRMFDVIDTEKYIGIVLEYAGGGELFEYILANRYLKEKDAQKLFAQLISGVDYLHKKHIVHRDLKLENLLLDKHRNIIITDFGFANRFDHAQDDLMATSCGSPCYAAPELVVSEGLYVGSAVDIWSCGVILYAMLSGYLPYDDDPQNPDGDNINLLYKYIMSTKLNFPDHMSPLAKSLLQIMLVPLPEHRCTISQIMGHPWLAGHQEMFVRSVEEHEYVFQEAMYRKSQQAKRELSERKRVQAEAREAKAAMQRSQSSVPGTTVTASMLDYHRRREQRHHSALPTTSTMPEYLSNAGHRTPPLEARAVMPPPPLPAPTSAQLLPEAPMVISPPSMPTPTMPTPPLAPSPDGSPRRQVEPTAPGLTPTESIAVESTMAVEDETLATPAVTPPAEPEAQVRPPMSSNKNRHTIQVEYDGEASYEKMQEAIAAKQKRESEEQKNEQSLAPVMPEVQQGGQSDIEMESGSSDNEQGQEDKADSIQEEAASDVPVLAPVIEPSPALETGNLTESPAVPNTPSKKAAAADAATEVASPATPRASAIPKPEFGAVTPRAERVLPAAATPKASVADRKRHDSMPPPSMAASSSVPEPRTADLKPSGLPKPPRRERYRKGMSLDKFGLAKLLGQASTANDENRTVPPSSSASAVAIQNAHAKRHSIATGRPGTSDGEKKTKRRTLQIMANRGSRDERSAPSPSIPVTPLTARDMNPSQQPPKSRPSPPPVVVQPEGIQPTASPQPGDSSPSIVTVDAFAAQQATPPPKTASSKAAKKVMDWFRRKSLAKDTLVGLKSAGVKSDSQSSFVRVSPHVSRTANRMGGSTANLAMSSVSSIGQTQEGPSVLVTDEEQAQPESATLPKTQAALPAEPSRSPLGNAANKANVQSTSDLLSPARARIPTPERSKSHRVSPSQSNAASTTSVAPTEKNVLSRPRAGSEDTKMRVHTGLVDQSALSSKPPKEVMAEVLKVLQEMGMDIKRENEFRLRCTRVRRRKAGATTGLGLGSVISVGSGMSPFTLMSSASTSKTDSRGLPMPMSPSSGLLSSGGLKGMLLRRGSSYASQTHLPQNDSEPFGSPSLGSTPNLPSTDKLPNHEPLYGEHSVDNGDEVKFVIELCRIKNLPGLYLLNIKRLRGSVWSFKFIYQTVLE